MNYLKVFFPFRPSTAPNSCRDLIVPVYWLLVALLVISSSSGCLGALDTGEKAALRELYEAFPALSYVPRWSNYDAYLHYIGTSWTDNFDDVCLQDGYEYYGVHCYSGHVNGLYVAEGWGFSNRSSFPALVGLTYLKNFTITMDSASARDLSQHIANLTQVVNFRSTIQVISTSWFSWPDMVQTIYGSLGQNSNLTRFNSLRYLATTTFLPERMPPSFFSTIEGLVVSVANFTWLAENIYQFTSLQDLSITANTDEEITHLLFDFSGTPLKWINIELHNVVNPMHLSVISPSVETIELVLPSLVMLELWTPNVVTFSFKGTYTHDFYPHAFANLTQWKRLRHLSLTRIQFPIPSLNFTSVLKELSINDWSSCSQSDLERVVCSLVGIQSLSLDNLRHPSTIAYELPSCLTRQPTIKTFQWTTATFNNTAVPCYGSSFWANLPPSVTLFRIYNPTLPNDTYTLDVFKRFSSLVSLDLADRLALVGHIPLDFWTALPSLKRINLNCNLEGPIPSVGWNLLESVRLSGRFDSWISIDSAPNLRELVIISNFLQVIPSDQVFRAAEMTSLKRFQIQSHGRLGGPIPTFWVNSPTIQWVRLDRNRFEGPFAVSFNTPSLLFLGVTTNQLCGSLPEFSSPLMTQSISMSDNRFSGTIPNSWAEHLTVTGGIQFFRNPISGSVPLRLSRPNAFHRPSIAVSDTQLTGPLWDLRSVQAFSVANVPLNLCDNPFPIQGAIAFCLFSNVSVCPISGNCTAAWNCTSGGLEQCTERLFVPQEVGTCIAPPPRPLPPGFCPQPPPSGFVCKNGIWISPGNVTEPTITLPPNSGVIVVNGSLSTSGPIVFNGLGSQIEVRDCVSNLPAEIVIEIGGDEKLHGTTLLSQKGSNCTNDLSVIPVRLQTSGESCKRTKVSTSTSTRSSLAVTFTVDSSRCNVKWIVLGSVVGGVTILIVATLILLNSFSPKFKSFLRKCLR